MSSVLANPDDFNENKPIRRKITKHDLIAIADLLAKRITETGACLILGIRPKSWFNFKLKPNNQKKFEDVLTRAKETQINAHIDNIEAFQVKDWRASAELLRIKDPQRFGQQQAQTPVNQTAIVVTLGGEEALRKLIAMYASQASSQPVVECEPVKSIDNIKSK